MDNFDLAVKFRHLLRTKTRFNPFTEKFWKDSHSRALLKTLRRKVVNSKFLSEFSHFMKDTGTGSHSHIFSELEGAFDTGQHPYYDTKGGENLQKSTEIEETEIEAT